MSKICDSNETSSIRITLYLNRNKNPELCDFLFSLPEGTISSFVRDVLQKYILTGGFTTPLKPLKVESPKPISQRRMPTRTPVQAKASRTQPPSVTVTEPTYVAPTMIAPIQPIQPAPAPQQVADSVPAAHPEVKTDKIRSLDHLSSLRSLVDEEDDGFIGLIADF